VLATFASACDGFRPVSEIDPIGCSGSSALEVYGSIDLDGDTIEFNNAMLVDPAPTASGLDLQDGSAHLIVRPAGVTRLDVDGKGFTGTTAIIKIDCEDPTAGRFEAWFVSGEVSGWWRADAVR
jgi:hypothetical protein